MGKRVRRFQTVNNNATTQGVDTSTTRPVEVAQSPEVIKTQASSMDKDGNVLDRTETVVTPQDPTLKFFGDVAAGGKNTLEGYAAIVDPEAYSEEGGEYYNRELRDKSVISGGIDTLTGKHTADEFFGEVGWRAQNEPGKLVGEIAVEAPLFFLNPLKVAKGAQAGSKVASNVLKSKLGIAAIKAADGPTRAEAIHANKMAKFNKSVGDVNKLNKEVNVASTKVRDEDVIIRGNRTYSKTTNPNEPRSQVDLYYQRLNEGGPPDVNVGGGFKDPAQAIGGFGKSMDEISVKSLRGSGQGDKMFKAAQFNVNKVQKDETVKALTNVAVKEDAWLAKAESNLLKDWRKFGGGRESFTINKNTEFLKGDKFLTGIGAVGAGAGGLGVFGLGGRKNDKSN